MPRNCLQAFDKAAEMAGVQRESILQKCASTEFSDLLVDYARLRDLTIIGVPESYEQLFAEVVIFGSGRPTLVLPETPRSRPFELGTVAVAWDFSRAAARSISDALPFLEKAQKVRVVTVIDEKHMDPKHSPEELAKNLARHGIDIVLDRVEANGKPIGSVLESYTLSHQVDLLVMGAYRWSISCPVAPFRIPIPARSMAGFRSGRRMRGHGPYLTARVRPKSRCPPGHCYCVKCRTPHPPAGAMAEFVVLTATSGKPAGLVPGLRDDDAQAHGHGAA
jgi:nucleotide-binding universal stress UspA family protein